MTMLEIIKGVFDKVQSAPVERTIADMLDKANVQETKFSSRVDGHAFVPGDSYFGVRLSGLHIMDARRFATQRLPLCVCLAEFEHAGQRRSIPFSVGPDVIRSKLQQAGVTEAGEAKSAWVELRDLPVVLPTPVTNGNLSLYAGLFSVPGDDLVKNLLNVVGTVGSALGQTAVVGAGVQVAETIYKSFSALLALSSVQQLAAALIGTTLTEGGSGYLLIAKVDAAVFDPSRGRVIDGRLHWPSDTNAGAAVKEFDYALLAIEYYRSIVEEATGLAPTLFQSLWLGALGSKEQSGPAFAKLQDAIAGSADITEKDRIALLGGYSLRFEQIAKARGWLKQESTLRGDGDAPIANRVTQLAKTLESESKKLPHPGGQDLSAQAKALHAIAGVNIKTPMPQSNATDDEKAAGDFTGVLAAARQVRAVLDGLSETPDRSGSRLSSLVYRSMRSANY